MSPAELITNVDCVIHLLINWRIILSARSLLRDWVYRAMYGYNFRLLFLLLVLLLGLGRAHLQRVVVSLVEVHFAACWVVVHSDVD